MIKGIMRIRIAALVLLTAGFAAAGVLDNAWLMGVTDKHPLSYKVGEEIVFTLTPWNLTGDIPADTYSLKWERTGDDGVQDNGKAPLTKDPFVYKTKLDKPGFVRLYAEVIGKDGKRYQKVFTGDTSTPEGREAANRFERQNKSIFFDGGAGAETCTLQALPEPEDFDAFWDRQRARLAKIPMKAERIELPCNNKDARIYAITIDCAGIRPVTGYLTIPKAADNGAKFPCRLTTHGYSYRAPHNPPGGARTDEIVLDINAHGMRLPAFGGDEGYYKALGSEIKSNGQSYAFDPVENKDPETAYFNGMALRVMRALEYLKSLPGWDGKNLIASGGSQGGLQTIWAAGLDKDVTHAESSITWCCDLGGERLGRNRGGWYIKWSDGLGYYDAVNVAKRIPTSCRTIIPRAGLGDYVCPPSGLAILWNNIKGPKKITWVQGSQHGYVPPEKYEGRDFEMEK
ncbi:MAG TPA: acetylxylan esterase [Kiritimatiellia bacterium]|nr:acetylxylan esterase [Kiritimatiellia bacterium]